MTDPKKTTEERIHTLFNPPATAAAETMAPWRVRLHDVIFEADTPLGHRFDTVLLSFILVSVAAVMLESVASIRESYGSVLRVVEWTLTVVFTVEYLLRLICVRRPLGYVFSFFGLVDLISVAPTYLSLFVEGTQALLVVRILRLLRVFRLFRLLKFISATQVLTTALVASRHRIAVFLGTVLSLVCVFGSVMYLVEGPEHGFTSIPRAMYWAIVTMTTVGYGDIAPQTDVGQAIAAAVMILGYAVIAVPTGIMSVEIAAADRAQRLRACPSCMHEGHEPDAAFCKRCGGPLNS